MFIDCLDQLEEKLHLEGPSKVDDCFLDGLSFLYDTLSLLRTDQQPLRHIVKGAQRVKVSDGFEKCAISDGVLLLVCSEDPSGENRVVFVSGRGHPLRDGRHDFAEVAGQVVVRGII